MNVSFKKRQEIYYRDGGKCKLCGRKLSLNCDDSNYIQLDHIKPKSQGGDCSRENLRATCKRCNSTRNKYSGAVLKKKILKDVAQSDIERRHKKRILDDIENGFLSLEDIADIQSKLKSIYQINMEFLESVLEHLKEGVN